ncbi:peptidoglycan DD-metalloendopeptidase family protein [Aequorivita sp. Q41]|uniref:peptidoglycan DD-metalloendopeptidase family protein n=1 Tax=Aequorivita sp. Q41 TaxID=3153300 RepID=UPI003241F792
MSKSNLISLVEFKNIAKSKAVTLQSLFPEIAFSKVLKMDMNTEVLPDSNYDTVLELGKAIATIQLKNPRSLLANGYLEKRKFYTTDAYKRTLENQTEYRNIHLGTDFWVQENTTICVPFAGKIVIKQDNNFPKDYGPTLVLEHTFKDLKFYTLYGHLSRSSLGFHKEGDFLKAGDFLGHIGTAAENGGWEPHLHFQVILDLLGNTKNFPGVAFPSEIEKWKSICPDPSLLFTENF